MRVRFTRRGFKQLSLVLDYIDARSPQGAENVKRQIQAAIDVLTEHLTPGGQSTVSGFAASSLTLTPT